MKFNKYINYLISEVKVTFILFSLHEIYTNNNNKTKYKNKYLAQNKHILRYIIVYLVV